jgi:hypothetical protein
MDETAKKKEEKGRQSKGPKCDEWRKRNDRIKESKNNKESGIRTQE